MGAGNIENQDFDFGKQGEMPNKGTGTPRWGGVLSIVLSTSFGKTFFVVFGFFFFGFFFVVFFFFFFCFFAFGVFILNENIFFLTDHIFVKNTLFNGK